MSHDALTAVQYGIGPIGSRIVQAAHRTGVEFVGAIDIDPDKVGRDLSDVAGLDDKLGVEVTDDASKALASEPDVVFHSTVSSIESAAPQLIEALEAGGNVISTTEELSYHWWTNEGVAGEIDKAAKVADGTVLGAGINPGFVMDALPAVLSTPMADVNSVHVERVQDAGTRRKPLQEKVGAGVSVETFEEEIVTEYGHVGSTESVAMLADALDFELDDVEESIEPIVADDPVETDYVSVDAGEVAGIKQVSRGYEDGAVVVTLDLRMYVGADDPHDSVDFNGEPNIAVEVEGGYHGDISTSAVIANVAPTVVDAKPGLATMTSIPAPSYTRHE